MSGVLVSLGMQPWPGAAPPMAAGNGTASSWSTHLLQAHARGWFREPLAPLSAHAAAPGSAFDAPPLFLTVAAVQPALHGSLGAVAPSSRSMQAGDLFGDACIPCCTAQGPSPLVAATTQRVGPACATINSVARGPDDEQEAAATERGAGRTPLRREAHASPSLQVHVETRDDGLHVWLGAAAGATLAAAASKQAWLQMHREGWVTVRTLVVNGRVEAGSARGGPRTQEDF